MSAEEPSDARVASVTADARAWQLSAHRGALETVLHAAGDAGEDLAAVLVGRRSSVEVPVPAGDPELTTVVAALQYGAGAPLTIRPTGPTSCTVGDDLMARDLAASLGSVHELLRRRDGRERFGPPPVIVLSTAGDPALVAQALSVHLGALKRFGHTDYRFLVIDDAPAGVSAGLERVIEAARAVTGATLVRVPEFDPTGRPGSKAAFRNSLRESVAHDARCRVAVDRAFASTAVGSANTAFALLSGRPQVWLEQDAEPASWHVDQHREPESRHDSGTTPIEWIEEHATPPAWARSTQVDILGVVDQMLYGPARVPTHDRLHPSWESTGYEAVAGPAQDPTRPRLCYFHLCGHADYRAEFSHHLLTSTLPAADVEERLLSGGLDRFAVLQRPPRPAVVRRGAMTFGTAVGLHHDLPLPVPMMLGSGQRIFDFTVAALLRSAGDCPAAVAGTGLTHVRAATTSSGRGWLPHYLESEQLLWPTYQALVEVLDSVPARTSSTPEQWFASVADEVARFAARYRLPTSVSKRIWLNRRRDLRLARDRVMSPRVASYLAKMAENGPEDWLAPHHALSAALDRELTGFAEQLRLYSVLGPHALDRARACLAGALEQLA